MISGPIVQLSSASVRLGEALQHFDEMYNV